LVLSPLFFWFFFAHSLNSTARLRERAHVCLPATYFVFASVFHSRFKTVGIKGQRGGWPGRLFESFNNDGDNKPLEMVAWVNTTLRAAGHGHGADGQAQAAVAGNTTIPPAFAPAGRRPERPAYRRDGTGFQWLVMGDDDTCFNANALRATLAAMDSAAPAYVGWVQGPSAGDYGAASTPALGLQHAHWAHGGVGVALSVGLLDAIRPEDWLWCIKHLSRGGGDVRVGVCVEKFGPAGLRPTEWPRGVSFHRDVDQCGDADPPAAGPGS
jgi:hypothetical protein